jgi:hypothetical protein
MYQFYKAMCSNYQGKVGNNKAYAGKNWYGGASLETMTGICGEYYDYVKYGSGASSQSGSAKFADYLSSSNKYMYFANFTVKEIKSYMDYLETAIAAVNAWGDTANKKACLNHVLQESLFPRLIICMSNSTNSNYGFGNGYSHSNKSYWTGDLASARTAFYNDCVALGWTKYSEHNSISLIFNKWVSDGTSWSRPSGGTL